LIDKGEETKKNDSSKQQLKNKKEERVMKEEIQL
jgi:hypothetical protein